MALTLEKVDEAIEKLMNGAQSVTVDGMSTSFANVETLRKLREDLVKQTGSRYGFGMALMKGPVH